MIKVMPDIKTFDTFVEEESINESKTCLKLWKLKNSDEYAVEAKTKTKAVKKFKKKLGIIATKRMIEKVN